MQERRDSRPPATQRPSQHPNSDERAIRRAKWWSRLFTDDFRSFIDLQGDSYLEAPLTTDPVSHHEFYSDYKRRFDHADVRTDRPERSYHELFSAAKEMTTDTPVTIPYPALCGNAPVESDISTVNYGIASLSTQHTSIEH